MLREEEILKLRKASEVSIWKHRPALLIKCGVFPFVYFSVVERDKHIFLPVLQNLSRI